MNFQEQWRKLLLPLRYGGSGVDFKKLDPARSPFLQDRDRIIYSSSFRRLARKTQVHPLVRNDHIHTRLSHSLEVSSVGRSLGAMAGYFLRRRGELPDYAAPEFPGQILEAACLAHDIGNPPFGHAGEFAIRDWFGDPANHIYVNALEETQQSDFRCFDGNAQGFRVVNVVENNRDQGGFRLTYPTLASMVKYPWDSWQSRARGGKCKFNYYQAEAAIFEDVFRALGLKTRRGDFARHPLSLLAEAADDTCYRIVDMEDARELDIITLADILKVVEPLAPSLKLDPQRLEDTGSDRERAGYVRARVIGHVTASLFETFATQYERIMRRECEGPLMDMAPEDVRAYMASAKEIFNERILKNSHKTALEIGSYSVYKRLLDTFIPACHRRICDPGRLTYKEQQALQLMGGHAPRREDDLYVSYLRVLDFITGMTDQYASFVSTQFLGTSC